MLKAGSGQCQDAWQDVLAANRMARQVGQHPILINRLVAMAIESLATRAGTGIAISGLLSVGEAQAIQADLAALEPLDDPEPTVRVSERLVCLDMFMMLQRGVTVEDVPGERLRIDINEMLRTANEYLDRQAQSKGRSESPSDVVEGKYWRAKTIAYMVGGWPTRKAFSRNMACLLLTCYMPAIGRTRVMYKETRVLNDLETVAFALATYKIDHQAYPKNLVELAPTYMPAVPNDRFSGKALIYKPQGEGYLLYSVGENGVDDGGRDRYKVVQGVQGDAGGDDLVVRCPNPPSTLPATTTAP